VILLRAGAAALALTVLAACGGGGRKTTAGSSGTSLTPSSTTPTSSTTASALAGSTAAVSVPPRQPAAHLLAVRAARQGSVDRVVFEFREQVPGYRVAYASGPVMNTEGREVPVAGQAKLVVHLEAATGADSYTGPARITVQGTTQVLELARVEDFEAVLSWVTGVRTQAPFRVRTLASPPRLVIDVSG
jgi:hypothetical protein